jgi:hypothetical protein
LPELSVAASQAIEIVVVVFAVSRRFVGLLGALRSTGPMPARRTW